MLGRVHAQRLLVHLRSVGAAVGVSEPWWQVASKITAQIEGMQHPDETSKPRISKHENRERWLVRGACECLQRFPLPQHEIPGPEILMSGDFKLPDVLDAFPAPWMSGFSGVLCML